MFQIINTTEPYQPLEGQLPPENSILLEFSSRYDQPRPVTHCIFLRESVWRYDIGEHIGWGQTTLANRVEQGGLLLGRVYHDKALGLCFGVVEKALPASAAEGSPTYLDINHQAWGAMLDDSTG